MTKKQQELLDKIKQLESWLAQIYRLTGADPDGNEDWRLAPMVVEEVARMRQELDDTEGRIMEMELLIP
jgi:hypothetical protein